jgi:hypothetical protein
MVDAKTIDELAKKERAEYFRKWRAANKDKVKKHAEDYWKRRAAQKLKEGEAK